MIFLNPQNNISELFYIKYKYLLNTAHRKYYFLKIFMINIKCLNCNNLLEPFPFNLYKLLRSPSPANPLLTHFGII